MVQQIQAEPELDEDEVTLALQASVARAADTIHLVIGGDEAMLEQARRTLAEAREVMARARAALASGRAAHQHARHTRERVNAAVMRTEGEQEGLRAVREESESRRRSRKDPKAD